MAIEYYAVINCKLRETNDFSLVKENTKERNRALQVKEFLLKSGKSVEEAENFEFDFGTIGLNQNLEIKKKKISSIIAENQHLSDLNSICLACPISINKFLGCVFCIQYPITKKAELWIMQLVLDSLQKGGESIKMIDFILDQKINGELFEKLRRNGNNFLEERQPLEIVISKNLFRRKAINSNQILQMIFGIPKMGNVHMLYLLRLLGGLHISDNEIEGKNCLWSEERKKFVFLGANIPKDADNCIKEILGLFNNILFYFIKKVDIAFEI